MSALLNAVYTVPQYLEALFTGELKFYAIGVTILFLIVLFFSNKLATVLRDLFVLAAVVYGVISYFQRDYEMFWICAAALVILIIFRLLRYIIVTIVSSRKTHRIEKAALEKAERRRGSWKDKKGFSGERPEEDDAKEVPYTGRQAKEKAPEPAVREVEETPIVIPPEEDEIEEAADHAAETIAEDGLSDEMLSRDQAISAAHKLKDLKDLGIMTSEEFERIKARLYSRLG